MPDCKHVVAVGASAGGLEPCERFFDAAPTNSGFAYVVVQHLSPDFRSLMDELLARHSSMPIHRVEEGMQVEPNTIYLNRPRQMLMVKDGRFVTEEYEEENILRLPIDVFFESMAQEYGPRAIAVVLSGSGTDGSRGAKVIKDRGGRVFAQRPKSAKFQSMPLALVEARLADGVADAEQLPAMISAHLAGQLYRHNDEDPMALKSPVQRVLGLLQDRFGTDFDEYKPETTRRRLERRLDLTGFATLQAYYEALVDDQTEQEAVYADLLIEVTAFFRDAEAFAQIKTQIIPELCHEMSRDHQCRIWVPGCASGEEAYSLAILVAEHARKNDQDFNLKILATDIHERSLSTASAGIYSLEALENMSPDLVQRYFSKVGENYQIKASLRRAVVFSPHDLLSDPPFTRMDLVSCRNVLIYLTEEAQRKVLTKFHFSLRKDGVLFLGPSETAGKLGKEFESISQRWRIYSKKRNVRIFVPSKGLGTPGTMRFSERLGESQRRAETFAERSISKEGLSREQAVIQEALETLLKRHAPDGFLVNTEGELVHVFGNGRQFLTFREGAFSRKLIDLLPEEMFKTASAMLERLRHGVFVENARDVEVGEGEDARSYRLSLSHLEGESGNSTEHALFCIETRTGLSLDDVADGTERVADDALLSSYAARVRELERALQSNEEALQSTIEEMETSNEELQATNEELMSSNEELQSTNEELHSVNEELYTVSAEHQRKIEELTEITSDMDHLLQSTNIGTLFLDEDLCLRRFTPAAALTFNLIEQDVGRPIDHITTRFEGVDLIGVVKKVSESGEMAEREIEADARYYLMRVLPYVDENDLAKGIVITTIDVNDLKTAQRRLSELTRFHSEVLQDIGQLVVRWRKADQIIAYCNTAFAKRFDTDRKGLLGKRLTAFLRTPSWGGVAGQLQDVKPGDFLAVEFAQDMPTGEIRYYSGLVRAIQGPGGIVDYFQFTGRDITEDQRYKKTLEDALDMEQSLLSPPDDQLQGPAHDERRRICSLIALVRDYLNAKAIVIVLQGRRKTEDLARFSATARGAALPDGAFDAVEALFAEGALDQSGPHAHYATDAEVPTHIAQLLAEVDARRAIIAPVIVRDTVIGQAAFAGSAGALAGPAFLATELSMVRIVMRLIGYIWERNQKAEELMRTTNELELIFNSVSSRIWYKDKDNRILRLNNAAAASMAMTVEEAVGLDTYAAFPEMGEKYHQDDLQVIKSGDPMLGIVEQYTPLNAPHGWISTDKTPYVDQITGETNLLVVATDITALMEREAQLLKVNSQLQKERSAQQELYLRTPAMMFSTGADSIIKNVNDLMASTAGYAREEMVDQPLGAFLMPRSNPAEQSENARALKCKDGKSLEVELASLGVKLPDSDEEQQLWVVQDVSARNAALKSLNDQNSELSKMNDGLAQFAYAASHDLQEPLRKISQYGELLIEEHRKNLGEEGQFFVDVMTSSAQRMSDLIKNLLKFSSAANEPMQQDEVSFKTLVDHALQEHQHLIQDANVTVELGDLPCVNCDPTLTQIVVTNITSNALKYRAPERDLTLKITGEAGSDSDDPVQRIVFEDNGSGIDDGEAERIFQPFARLIPKSKVQGNGIGLSICRAICDRHGWHITASGSKGKGARFVITIPKKVNE
ncbi:MAG: CheR family methyltransferase [Pseudomonadota bacterium]